MGPLGCSLLKGTKNLTRVTMPVTTRAPDILPSSPIVSPEGTLIRTGTDLRRVSMQRSVSARALEGGSPRL